MEKVSSFFLMKKFNQKLYWKNYYRERSPKWKADRQAERVARPGYYIKHRVQSLRSRHPSQPVASGEEIEILFQLQNGRCALTGRDITLQTAQLDHIMPVSRGGAGTIDNLRWVHKDANNFKREMTDAEFDSVCIDRVRFLGLL